MHMQLEEIIIEKHGRQRNEWSGFKEELRTEESNRQVSRGEVDERI